jgi:hypothetical protein
LHAEEAGDGSIEAQAASGKKTGAGTCGVHAEDIGTRGQVESKRSTEEATSRRARTRVERRGTRYLIRLSGGAISHADRRTNKKKTGEKHSMHP